MRLKRNQALVISLGRGSWRSVFCGITLVALTFYVEFDRLNGKMGGYAVGNTRFDLVQAKNLAAGRAFEMGVVVLGIALRELKAPGTIIT